MNVELTKDADEMICQIYAAYMKRRESGISKESAKGFGNKATWPDEYSAGWDSEDGSETLTELARAGLITSSIHGGFCLEDRAIIYMESKPGLLEKALDIAARLKSAFPFL